jgi:hypothetical protein
MEFRLSRSPSLSFFSRWNFGYHGAFFTNFFFFRDGISAITEPFSRTLSFFTMEFQLSRSLFHELFLFSRWNFGYHGAFLTNSFFFHDGISAITEPFSRTFSFFTMEFRLSRSLFHELFLFFYDGISRHKIRNMQFGGRLFSYIYIRKSIYMGSASLKTLPLDLEPPLQGKEYSYSSTTIRK